MKKAVRAILVAFAVSLALSLPCIAWAANSLSGEGDSYSNLIPAPGPEDYQPTPSFPNVLPGGPDVQPASPSLAFNEILIRLVFAWDVYEDICGDVDRDELITETQLANMMYATYCLVKYDPPTADPRFGGSMSAYSAEAAAWVEENGFGNAYESGVNTYSKAIDAILGYLGDKVS